MEKFDKPLKTKIQWDFMQDSSIYILGQTKKAYLMVIVTLETRGTSMVKDHKEREQWIPKSIWDNDKNFETYNYMAGNSKVTTFKPPYFLR